MKERRQESPPRLRAGGDDLLGGSAAAASGAARGEEDATERWGRLVGRGLAVAASVALIGWALFEAAAKAPAP